MTFFSFFLFFYKLTRKCLLKTKGRSSWHTFWANIINFLSIHQALFTLKCRPIGEGTQNKVSQPNLPTYRPYKGQNKYFTIIWQFVCCNKCKLHHSCFWNETKIWISFFYNLNQSSSWSPLLTVQPPPEQCLISLHAEMTKFLCEHAWKGWRGSDKLERQTEQNMEGQVFKDTIFTIKVVGFSTSEKPAASQPQQTKIKKFDLKEGLLMKKTRAIGKNWFFPHMKNDARSRGRWYLTFFSTLILLPSSFLSSITSLSLNWSALGWCTPPILITAPPAWSTTTTLIHMVGVFRALLPEDGTVYTLHVESNSYILLTFLWIWSSVIKTLCFMWHNISKHGQFFEMNKIAFWFWRNKSSAMVEVVVKLKTDFAHSDFLGKEFFWPLRSHWPKVWQKTCPRSII